MCDHPLLAVDRGFKEDGKTKDIQILCRIDEIQSIKQARERYEKFSHRLIFLPCGKCASCRAHKRKEWSARCEIESRYHKENCFITLTYDQDTCPHSVSKRDLQLFFKKLRKKYHFSYFAVGEYGGQTMRPHYHMIIFGFIPHDLKYHAKSKNGDYMFRSKLIEDTWKKGFCTVQNFAPGLAAYTAGYVSKKLVKEDRICLDGVIKDPEFFLFSKGIGKRFFLENYQEIYNNDSLVVSFGSHRIGVFRYFDKLLDKHHPELSFPLYCIKERRAQMANASVFQELRIHGFKTLDELFEYNFQLNENKLKNYSREL